MDDPILNQIASLEARALSLRDSLATLPLEQRAFVAEGLERVRAAVAEALAAGTLPPADAPHETPDPLLGADEPIWTAERTTRLYAINTALSVALTNDQAAEIVVNQALPALAADAGVVILSSDGETLKPLDGANTETWTGAGLVALTQNSPFEQVVRTAQPVWIESPADLEARFPLWSSTPWRDAGAIAAVPLIAEGRVLGVMAFRFDTAQHFTIADRAFMLVLGQQCAAAIERVHLYERVRRAAAVEERNRLARDLHDSVSQALYAIVLSVTVGRNNLARDLARVARALDNIESLTGLAQADLRALLFDLRADSVSQTGLVGALEERARFIRLRHGLAVKTELCGEPVLGVRCKEALYGIAREALHNAAKHARASEVVLKLCATAEGLTLEIKDDGIGFRPGEPPAGHYGLQSMRERAAELGAALRIETAQGQGTRVVAVVPASESAAVGHEPLSC